MSQCHVKQLNIDDYHHHRQIIYHQQPVVSVTTIVVSVHKLVSVDLRALSRETIRPNVCV